VRLIVFALLVVGALAFLYVLTTRNWG